MIREGPGTTNVSFGPYQENDGFGDEARGSSRVSYAPLPHWKYKGKERLGQVSLCGDARSSEKLRTNEGELICYLLSAIFIGSFYHGFLPLLLCNKAKRLTLEIALPAFTTIHTLSNIMSPILTLLDCTSPLPQP